MPCFNTTSWTGLNQLLQNVGELLVDLDNKVILESHLQCAANEMPIHATHDKAYFGPSFKEICESRLKKDVEGWYVLLLISSWTSLKRNLVAYSGRYHTNPAFLPYPSKYISIRGIQEDKYAVVDVTLFDHSQGQAKVIEELELSRAIFEVRSSCLYQLCFGIWCGCVFQLYEGGVVSGLLQ